MIIKLPNNIEEILAELSQRSNHTRYRHSAIIYDLQSEKIVATGYNYVTETKTSIHAERMAIEKIRKKRNNDFSTKVMIVARRTNTGFALSKPCPSCQKAIDRCGFPAVFYTTSNTKLTDLRITIK